MAQPSPQSPQEMLQLVQQHLHAGRFREAEPICRQLLLLFPDEAGAHTTLGIVLFELGQIERAMASFQCAIELDPKMPEAHNNLAKACGLLNLHDRALAAARQAVALRPNWHEPYINLGKEHQACGEPDAAIAAYRKALELKPDWSLCHSNLVYSLYFHPASNPQTIYDEHVRWRQRHADPLQASIRPHDNDRDPDQRLRIGYVSPDFRRHPVGRFILPLISNHDREQFQVFCYSDMAAARVDHITEKLKSCASCWRDTKALSDAELAELIRRDRIDLLIDLTMHMADNRLRVFAMKPAPVQVTYLAYVGTTGLDTIDYRITDPYLDPRGASSAEPIYSEQSIHLPNSYWCYTPPEEAPAVVDRGDQSITLGCLNLFWKASPSALAAWCRVLHAAPGSRMILHAPEGAPRQRVIELLQTNGIDPQRMQFVGIQPFEEYLKTYQQIDIALDPFPYNGGTTSCDALWMGVPVVSCIGILAVGRAGLSILSNIGLPKLVAGSVDEYVRIAVELANDRPRLSELRAGLRERMLRSPLMDALAFARDMEQAYRTMWRRFCGT